MNAGTITRETSNPQIMEFSVEIGLPLMIGAPGALCRAAKGGTRKAMGALQTVAGGALMTLPRQFLPVGRGFAADQRGRWAIFRSRGGC